MPWRKALLEFPTDLSAKSLIEWGIKSTVFLASTMGVTQLKTISEQTKRIDSTIGEIKSDVSILNKRVFIIENEVKK